MNIRAVDDFEFIRTRIEQSQRACRPAPLQPPPTRHAAVLSDEDTWQWDGFSPEMHLPKVRLRRWKWS
jgi:hypothetical protein